MKKVGLLPFINLSIIQKYAYNTIKRINKSFNQCIEKNNKLMALINIIVRNYYLMSNHGNHFQSISNLGSKRCDRC